MSRINESELRSGLGLMQRTLTRYRRDLVPAVIGALLWMAMVVSVP